MFDQDFSLNLLEFVIIVKTCPRRSGSVANLPYVLNGPIYLFLLGILLMGLEVNILYENNMLQGLLQICKVY